MANQLECELGDAINSTPERAVQVIQNISVGQGVFQLNDSDVDVFAVYRYIVQLFEDAVIPVRRAVAFEIDGSRHQTVERVSFARVPSIMENTLMLMRNLSKIVFPAKIPTRMVELRAGEESVTTAGRTFSCNNQPIMSYTNDYLFTANKDVSVRIQTELDSGIKSIEQNYKRLFAANFLPIPSSHVLWNNVRISGFDANTGTIKYVLTNLLDSGFVEIFNSYRFRDGRMEQSQSGVEDKVYNSAVYMSNVVQEMHVALNFTVSDKKKWTSVRQAYPRMETLADFESIFCSSGTLYDSVIAVASVKGVTFTFAERVMEFMKDKIRGVLI